MIQGTLIPWSYSSTRGITGRKARWGGAIEIVNNGSLASYIPQQTRKASCLIPAAGHRGFWPGPLSTLCSPGPVAPSPCPSAVEVYSGLVLGLTIALPKPQV